VSAPRDRPDRGRQSAARVLRGGRPGARGRAGGGDPSREGGCL